MGFLDLQSFHFFVENYKNAKIRKCENALPSGHSGPGKWSQHIPPDVSWLDPTLIHADPPFRSLQASLWPQEAHLWPFGQFLAIKWAKMAGSKVCLFGSRPSSTQRTTYIHWFSRKDNFEIPPPLNTLWAGGKLLINWSKLECHTESDHVNHDDDDDEDQRWKMSRIWRIYPCKKIGQLG